MCNSNKQVVVFKDGKIMINGEMRGLPNQLNTEEGHHRFVRTNIDRAQKLGNANPDILNSDNRDPFDIICENEERIIQEEKLFHLA